MKFLRELTELYEWKTLFIGFTRHKIGKIITRVIYVITLCNRFLIFKDLTKIKITFQFVENYCLLDQMRNPPV